MNRGRPRGYTVTEATRAKLRSWPRPSLAERYWKKVQKTDGCWNWIGSKNSLGYGKILLSGNTLEYAHRLALTFVGIEVPDRWKTGLVVDHICKNRGCVNPAHLRIIPHRENSTTHSVSPMARNAAKTHCVHGHPLSDDNIAILHKPARSSGGRRTGKCTARICLTCYPSRWRYAKIPRNPPPNARPFKGDRHGT